MKRLLLGLIIASFIAIMCLLLLTAFDRVYGQDIKKDDPNKLFYTANYHYQKQDYLKAVEEYLKLLDMGIENGNLYYNIGNSFLKLGKTGYAILCYERARRFIPHDSDLRANIEYARSLVRDQSYEQPHRNIVLKALLFIYRDFSLNNLSVMTLASYLILLLSLAVFVVNPIIGKRFAFIAVILAIIFIVNATAFLVRFYGEEILKHGVVVKRSVEVKYEPIDKSTTYYTINEGDGVMILKTKEGWRQIRRRDGKVGWINKEAAEEI